MNPYQPYIHAIDCRQFLLEEFENIKKRRPSYSIRAFARDVGVDSSRLTAILNGKYGLSKAGALSIGERLSFDSDKLRFFADLAESRYGRSKVAREKAAERIEKIRFNLNTRKFKTDSPDILKHWYYAAIHQLVTIEGRSLDFKRIASKLNISISEAKSAVDFLLVHELITRTADGYGVTDHHVQYDSPSPSQTIRNYHHQILDKTSEAIESVNLKDRKNLSSIFSIKRSKIPEAREWLAKTHREFVEKFGTSQGADRVYALGLHLVPVDGGTRHEK